MIRLTVICLALIALAVVPMETANAGATVDVHLVVRETATPVTQAVATLLPSSITAVPVGASYVVEIWMQDTWDASPGLTGGRFDLHYDTNLSNATSLHYEGPFDVDWRFRTGSILDGSGLVEGFGDGTLQSSVGVTPNYARLGYIVFSTSLAGTQHLTLGHREVARYGMGLVDPSVVNLGGASITVVPEPGTFALLWIGIVSCLARLPRCRRR